MEENYRSAPSRGAMESTVTIHPLTLDDLAFAQCVREIAGWNQTDRDWVRLLESGPDGCFLARIDGQAAGTATTTCYGQDLAWIGMVLVHPNFRRRKAATLLMEHCLRHLLEEKRVRCVKLDATPAGQLVYEQIGFHAELELSRWEGETIPGEAIASADRFVLETVRGLDRKAFGADRGALLNRLAAGSLRVRTRGSSYGMIHEGSKAGYLGPVIADSVADGTALVRALLQAPQRRPVYWDILEDNRPAVALAESLGFRRQRPLVRMWTGRENAAGEAALQWALGGLETG